MVQYYIFWSIYRARLLVFQYGKNHPQRSPSVSPYGAISAVSGGSGTLLSRKIAAIRIFSAQQCAMLALAVRKNWWVSKNSAFSRTNALLARAVHVRYTVLAHSMSQQSNLNRLLCKGGAERTALTLQVCM